ncbi:restriction endonuclease subunit S [Escherichia coli]|nr:restriction endonuclease subunit S [Escherichia coli]MCV5582873.1 restriction endonuclease subunit S [Escherichia coli]MDS1707165.1 restriction endonuclease subunit S [Escherichia coli]MDS1763925.1 restriction endonuclease subunit S [Escherichia coli]MDY5571981.1 restriction endonuclease subunit S [Escherichia coli]WMY35893.1 restriction endonuclease subunit S [Escherichia coli]
MSEKTRPESWLSKIAIDCFDQISTTNNKVKSTACSPHGLYPVIDQGQNYISGYINDESKLIKITTPICIFGDHTRIIKWVEHNFVPGADGTKLLKPKDFIYPRYAYYSLCALNIPDKGYSRHFKYFKELKIDIPAWEEQKIIAEKLDTLLAQVESTKARLEQIPQILKRFRQAVLGTAMSGNLTGEWRLSNHSIILAEEIEENKNRLIEKKLVKKDLTYASLDKRYSLPPSWLYIKLQSVSTKITDGEHKTPKRETAGKFLLSARNIQDGYIKLADVDYVGDAEFQKLRNRCDPDYGDILISCSGSIGRVCLVDENSKYVMVRSVALVKLMQDFVINKYMMFLLQSPLLQKEIEENSKSTAQSNLFLGPIKNLGIPLPPVSEQHEIVRRVEQLFAYADTIEKQVNNALARVNNLTQSILAKAFRGELTAQWRAENPELISGENSAAALLEKIKAERAASGGKKASRKKS